jgi:acyl-CoA thioesterase-1
MLNSGRVVFVAAALTAGVAGVQAAEIVALGASNTEGKGHGRFPDGVPRAQAYPAQLQALLASQGCRVRVANAGVAGDTTSGMLRRLNSVLSKDTKVLILQPGGNDARRGESGGPQNVAAITQAANARGIKVVMLESLGRLAPPARLPDGQHFSAAGHATFAAYLAPRVRAAGAC